jgi:Type six secretion immunity 3 domain
MAQQTWRSRAPIAMAFVLAAAWSSGAGQAQSRPEAQLERFQFALGSVRYQILLPKRSRLERRNEPGCIKLWHPRSQRTMTFLQLCAAPGTDARAYTRQTTLPNGARVRYSIDHDIGGGSGGTEGELKGQLDLGGKVIALTCRDQGEWGNDPGWCLQYLRYLEVKQAR